MGAENVAYASVAGNQAGPDDRLKDVARLLVVAPSWLGDAVMALPALADLRRAAPHARMVVAARPMVAPLFSMVPGVDRVATLDAGRSVARDVATLQELAADAALLLPNSFRAAFVVWRAGIQARWGYRTALRSSLLTAAPLPPADVHQAVYYQQLTSALGVPKGPLVSTISASDAAKRAAGDLLASEGWNRTDPIVALAPGAAYGGAKRWPPASFAELASALAGDGVLSVLVGGPGDRAAGAEVVRHYRAGKPLLNLIGRTDLPTLAGVLASSRVLVSNDSGAMHIASALGVPVAALFGPTDEQATHPVGAGAHTILTHPVWCRPCMLRECPIDHRCMTRISVERALEAARCFF